MYPMLFHAAVENPCMILPEKDLPEDVGANLLKKCDEWCRLKNGGFPTLNSRGYQEA